MPRTGGVYSPPAGTKGVPNTTIQSVPYNTLIDDLTADANAPRPLTSGGTGATSASGARTALGLEIGTNVQAQDAGLQSIAGLTTTTNQMLYTTGTDAYATTALTPFARTILDDVDAAGVRATIGANDASTLITGTIADARLPATMSGKAFVGSVVVNNGSVTGYAVLSAGNTTNTGYIDFRKADGNRAGYIGYATNGGGNIDLNAEVGFRYNFSGALGPTYGGTPLVTTAGASFTGAVWAPNFLASNDFQIRSNGDRYLYFMNSAGNNRGVIVHNNAIGAMQTFLYNTSGTFVRSLTLREDGGGFWGGHMFEVGNNVGTAEFRFNANANRDHRLLSDASGSFYVQYSNNEWSTASTLVWWDAAANANLGGSIYTPTGFFTSGALGSNNGLVAGNGDNATYASHNLRISTWYGVGIYDSSSGNCRIVFDARGGHITNTGNHAVGGTMYVGSAAVFGDGNMQFSGGMLGYGAYLSDALSARATVYTGSNQDEVNLPVGHSVLSYSNGTRNRNQGYATYLSTAAYQFTLDVGASAQLGGTWRARGQITYSSGNSMVQMQRTA
ncbi:tail fiber protein [Ensifer adhaerens]|uniref:tail fiber protein n=1 Tax=Ensifer adhaerens TaxID=106592 RepID=UPI0023A93C17|nr:tail fiber protein [Ensifer adhaerens]WDZ78748.1 tail fiber protein [Ensifer adhaerens]